MLYPIRVMLGCALAVGLLIVPYVRSSTAYPHLAMAPHSQWGLPEPYL